MKEIPHRSIRRRVGRIAIALALLIGLMPFGGAISAEGEHDATRTPVSFTSTTVEDIAEGEFTAGEDGSFQIDGLTFRDEVTGDIEGEAIITLNIAFQPAAECAPDDAECPGYTSVGGHVEVTDENGTWEGNLVWNYSTVDGEEYNVSKMILHGHGGNAGQSIVVEITDETGDTVTFEGFLVTMATPVQEFNVSTQFCSLDDETGEYSGGFLSQGAVSNSGTASATFAQSGAPGSTSYRLFGDTVLTNEHGSLTVQFVGTAQDGAAPSTGFYSSARGHFVIVDGTGAYADLYGHGKVIGSLNESNEQCGGNPGASLTYIGTAHYN